MNDVLSAGSHNQITLYIRKNFMSKKKSVIPGLSFSVNKALGITKAKRKIAKATGIPTTKSGRQAKAGRMLGL